MPEISPIERLSTIRHLALDMDGTIYLGGTLFDFTKPFLARMRDLGVRYTFLTNNASKSVQVYRDHLKKLGIDAADGQIHTSGVATIDFLRADHPQYTRILVLGTNALRGEFVEAGLKCATFSATDEPDAVVVSMDASLQYDHLCMAGYWIRRGKPYFATHPDVVCPTDQETLLVDCGAICDSLKAATGREPDAVLGKPNPRMLDRILRRHDLHPRELAMVGDRLNTDIATATASGALGVLVLTGEATAEDVETSEIQPDLVVSDLGELGRLIARANDFKSNSGR